MEGGMTCLNFWSTESGFDTVEAEPCTDSPQTVPFFLTEPAPGDKQGISMFPLYVLRSTDRLILRDLRALL